MRLTCPNCGAQYEVSDAVIPVAGRDVQCSNCGTTWFQNHPDHEPAAPEDPKTDPDETAEPEHAANPAPDPDTNREPSPATGRRLDPSVADILREEADRERAARAAEAGGRIETQPDLGLGEPEHEPEHEPEQARRAREARDRMQRLRGDRPAGATAKQPDSHDDDDEDDDDPDEMFDDEDDARLHPGSRRNLFPDIDEINSSLTASDDNTGALAPKMSDDAPLSGRGGFRAGFRLAVVSCVVALVVYVLAPRIAGLWPAAEAPLGQYVQAVDTARNVLTTTVSDLIARF